LHKGVTAVDEITSVLSARVRENACVTQQAVGAGVRSVNWRLAARE
jgi:hypothetical protein